MSEPKKSVGTPKGEGKSERNELGEKLVEAYKALEELREFIKAYLNEIGNGSVLELDDKGNPIKVYSQEDGKKVMRLKCKTEKTWSSLSSYVKLPEAQAVLSAKEGYLSAKVGSLKSKHTLKGHLGKIYAMHWCPGVEGDVQSMQERRQILSASQDGRLIIWDAYTTHKLNAITMRSSWVMTCAYSPSGNFVACGGLDNLCSIYSTRSEKTISPVKELLYHTGYLSGCRFLDDKRLISTSGDKACALWDIEKSNEPVAKFLPSEKEQIKGLLGGHSSDVTSVALSPDDPNLFVTGSVDTMAILWDIRKPSLCLHFQGHTGDVNSVDFSSSGRAIVTGSDDKTCKLFDVRSLKALQNYELPATAKDVTSVALSKSGRILFAGTDDSSCYVWDSLTGESVNVLQGHINRVSCLGLSADGYALCTGSWDNMLMVWGKGK